MPRPLTLFTPGPVEIPDLVRAWLADPPVRYHRQAAFAEMMGRTERWLRELLDLGDDVFATVLATTGTGANEAVLQMLAARGPGVIVSNGFFGDRLLLQAARSRCEHVVFRADPSRPLDPEALAAFLSTAGAAWCYFVGHETRTGLLNPIDAVAAAAKRHVAVVAADVISAAYALPVELRHVDIAVASSAKGIMAVPGLGIVFVRDGAWSPGRDGVYLDLHAEALVQRRDRQPRFAQPVALHAALHAACLHLREIGLAAHHARIQRQMAVLVDHLETLGCPARLAPAHRSNVAVNFDLPPGLDYPTFAAALEANGCYALYGIPGDASHFQLSTMGDLADTDVAHLCQALTRTLATGRASHSAGLS
jgi:aspartate aminotransferase-like enzyme